LPSVIGAPEETSRDEKQYNIYQYLITCRSVSHARFEILEREQENCRRFKLFSLA
jgi:hypothetical protein